MSVLDGAEDTALAALPRYVAQPTIAPKTSVWQDAAGIATALPRGIASAMGEGMASGAEVLAGLRYMGDPRNQRAIESGGMPAGAAQSDAGDALRYRAREFKPDPQTATTAEQLLYGFARGGSKLIAGTMLGGPVGAALAGAEEANTVAADLGDAGVQGDARIKAAVVQGAGLALGALPLAGQTLQQTLALYLAGGPGGFFAQQALTRHILADAGYQQQAEAYNPLDWVGLAVSALVPAPFAAVAHYRNKVAAAVRSLPDLPRAEGEPPHVALPEAMPSELSPIARAIREYDPQTVDAARVAYQMDRRAASNPDPAPSMGSANAHEAALSRAEQQMADGERVSVADVAPILARSAVVEQQITTVEAEIQSLLPTAGDLAERGAIRAAREQLALMEQTRVDTSDEAIRSSAKDIQRRDGVSYKEALSKAKKIIEGRAADWQSQSDRLNDAIARNASAQQATQRIGELQDLLGRLRAEADSPAVRWARELDANVDAARQQAQFDAFYERTGAGGTRAEPATVFERIANDLTATGRVTEQAARDYAAMTSEFYSALGARLGISADEAYRLHPLTISGEGGQRGVFAQALPAAWPTAVGVNPTLDDIRLPDLATLRQNPKQYQQAVDAVAAEPGMRTAGSSVDARSRAIIKRMVDNLLWLHDQMPEEIRNRARLWYDGGQAIAQRWADKWGKTRAQTAGMLATLSPQKDWFMNTTMGERVGDILSERMGHVWDNSMTASAFKFLAKDVAVAEDRLGDEAKNLAAFKIAQGKTLAEVIATGDRRAAGVWIRAYDEAHHGAEHAVISPEGNFEGNKLTAKGEEARRAWGDFNAIGKAASIFIDGSPKNISEQIGGEHKVRNFYNNLFNASDARFTTIDTHAVAAALLRPLAGADKAVADNFGKTGGTNLTGVSGSYPLYYEAYRQAAAARGLLPREMQSVTWEAVRGLFTEGFKNEANKAAIDAIWRRVDNGKLSVAEARAQIMQMAGGINPPDWWRPGESSPTLRDKTYEQQRREFGGSRVVFEVAPDPRDSSAKARWEQLSPEQRQRASHDVAWTIAAKALASFNDPNMRAELHMQMGGWRDDTNPALALWMEPNASGAKIMRLARMIGYALNQEAMMVTAPKRFSGSDASGVVVVHGVDAADAKMVYDDLRANLRAEDGSPLIEGHTTGGGAMAILVPRESAEVIARKVADHLGDKHEVSSGDIHVAWPEKGGDDYGLSGTQTTGSDPAEGSSLLEASHRLRAEAAARLSAAIDEAGAGRSGDPGDPGFGHEGVASPDPGRLGQDGGTRGAYEPSSRTISLLERADPSTFIHESGHFYFDTLARVATDSGAPPDVRADAETLARFAGASSLEEWSALTLEQQRPGHEKIAKAFEAYVMEGKAPTAALAQAFERMKAWLIGVYRNLTGLGADLTPEVRQVFDRMLGGSGELDKAASAKSANADAAPSVDPRITAALQQFPDLHVMLDGMDAPVRAADLLDSVRAEADGLRADAPDLLEAAQCAILNGL